MTTQQAVQPKQVSWQANDDKTRSIHEYSPGQWAFYELAEVNGNRYSYKRTATGVDTETALAWIA